MADFAAPNLFRDSGGANVPAAIESGFGMGVRKQELDMRKQDFANQQADREEMRNAMAEYGSAQSDEEKQAALSKVGIVSPEARARLEDTWMKSNAEQRKAIAEMNDAAGSAAYMALQETDPAKRQAIWDGFRNNMPEKMRNAIPATADDLSLKVSMAQSTEAREQIMMLDKITAQGEKQKDVAGYQGSISAGLEDRKHGNRMAESDYEFEQRRKLEDKKMLNQMTEKAVGAELKGGSQGIRPADAVKLAESRDPELRQLGRQALGLNQPIAQQAPAAKYKYVVGQGLVPITE